VSDLSVAALLQDKRVLHFGPHPALASFVRGHAREYVTADLQEDPVDLKLDMSNMPEVADAAFDVVVAFDVLEHVQEDRRALREVFRVLSPGGRAILTVPQKDELAATLEDPAVTEPEDRKRLFGQADHLRIYGHDFPRRLEEAGFAVRVVGEADFPPETVGRHVLAPPVISERPLATNRRHIFFGRKP